MRIVSLVPEAAEILNALGLGGAVTELPADAVTTPGRLAAALQAIQPALIFTSASAAGGGVPRAAVRRAIAAHRPRPAVYALEPHTLGDILSDIKTVGDATGRQQAARTLIEALRVRIDAVTLRSAQALASGPPTRVACLTVRERLTAAGWWLAELVGLAGGLDVLHGLGRPPRVVTWAEIEAARPELVLWAEEIAVEPSPPQPLSAPRACARASGEPHRDFLAVTRGELHPGPLAVTLLERLADAILLPAGAPLVSARL